MFQNIWSIPIIKTTAVMVNFMCQLDWAMVCPDSWSNVTVSMSERVFCMELIFDLVDRVKEIALPSVAAPHPIS